MLLTVLLTTIIWSVASISYVKYVGFPNEFDSYPGWRKFLFLLINWPSVVLAYIALHI